MSHTPLTSGALASRGLRRTAVREAVLRALAGRGRPLSHAELARVVGAGVDRVTLYRTLNALHEAGLVHRVLGEDAVRRYSSHDPDAPACPGDHPHFLCLECGRMRCLSGQALPRVTVPRGCQVRGKQLVVFGLCEACRTPRRRH